MRLTWKRRDIFTVVLVFAMLFCILLPVLGAPSGPSIFRYDDKKTGISNMVSDIVEPEARWTFESGAEGGSVPMAGDIDSDGKIEVVWGSGEGILYALDENGQIEWTFEASGPLYAPPVIGDLDGDGIMEVVCGGYYNGVVGDANLYALNGEDGSLLWTFSTMGEGSPYEKGFEASPSLYDVNDDGKLDVLVGSRNYYFYALNGLDGTVLWKSQFEHFIRASAPIGDIDNDGDDEIFVMDNHAFVKLLDMNGNVEWEMYLPSYGTAPTAIFADLTGNGYDEIIIFTTGFGGIPGVPLVYRYDGSLLWTNEDHIFFYSTPTLYDVDGDGLLDILNVDSDDQTLIAYKGTDGSILYTAEPFEGYFQAPGLSTADIDGDGEIEVLAGALPNLYSINPADGSVEWVYETGESRAGGPIIVDLDGDGLAEVIIRAGGNIVCIQNKVDPMDLLDKIIEYILGLPDDCFKNNADNRKNSLVNKLESVRDMINDGDYEDAISKLENDIRPKMDGEGNNDWIINDDAQNDLTGMIDELIEYLETLL